MTTKNLQSGMTLIELIVVISIIAMVSAVLLFSYSGFSGNASIRNLAQEIALGIRKSQIYATSVARTGSITDPIYGAYGVSFSTRNPSTTTYPSSKRFIFFADIPPTINKWYDSPAKSNPFSNCGGGTECLETFTINSSDKIVSVQACNNSGCTPSSGQTGGDSVDIIFQRPSPDAYICLNKDGSGCSTSEVYSHAKIVIESVKGLRKTISVWNTGQISVQ